MLRRRCVNCHKCPGSMWEVSLWVFPTLMDGWLWKHVLAKHDADILNLLSNPPSACDRLQLQGWDTPLEITQWIRCRKGWEWFSSEVIRKATRRSLIRFLPSYCNLACVNSCEVTAKHHAVHGFYIRLPPTTCSEKYVKYIECIHRFSSARL